MKIVQPTTRKLYKLTDPNLYTYGSAKWRIGKWKETDGIIPHLCTGSWLHAYTDPYVGVLMNPIHGNFAKPRLFEAEGEGYYLNDNGLKCGVTRLRIMKEIPLPKIKPDELIKIAEYCILEVNPTFTKLTNAGLPLYTATTLYTAMELPQQSSVFKKKIAHSVASSCMDARIDLPSIIRQVVTE
jgi:hypothetical protein